MSEKTGRKKDPYIDAAKGIAIVLVVIGHTIQYSYQGDNAFFDNIVFRWIYSFHMPLFMIISGYLFGGKARTDFDFGALAANRAKRCLVPVLSWTLLISLYHGWIPKSLSNIRLFAEQLLLSYWFLWAVFFCSLAAGLVCKYTKEKYWIAAFTAVIIISLITPDAYNFDCHKFMFPCFAAGILIRDSDIVKKIESKKAAVIAGGILYIGLFMMYRGNAYIYIGGWTLLNADNTLTVLFYDIYRVVIGVVGSGMVLFLISKAPKKLNSVLGHFGTASTGIYIISILLGSILMQRLAGIGSRELSVVIGSILTLAASYVISAILAKNKLTGMLFLGNKIR